MNANEIHIGLNTWLRHRFNKGFAVDRDHVAFMEQTFGASDLQAVLADTESSETAAFLELLLYPDQATRIAFENRWGNRRFSADQVDAQIADLTAQPLSTRLHLLHLPGQTEPVDMIVPEFAAAAFVQRLHIDWFPPEPLHQFLNNQFARPERARVRARLRCAHVNWSPHKVAFLMRFLETIAVEADDFSTGLRFLLSIIDELLPDQTAYLFLVDKKRTYFHALCRAEAFERRRQTVTMETMMMQGERAAHGDIAQWRAHMRMIDRISEALYGRTQFFHQPAVQEAAVAQDGQDRRMEQVIRLLKDY